MVHIVGAGPGAEDGGAAESEAGDKDIEAFAEAEQLTAHANSVRVRFEK